MSARAETPTEEGVNGAKDASWGSRFTHMEGGYDGWESARWETKEKELEIMSRYNFLTQYSDIRMHGGMDAELKEKLSNEKQNKLNVFPEEV